MGEWAGSFSCDACKKTRLIASHFSNNMIQKKMKNPDAKITCKDCTQTKLSQERSQDSTLPKDADDSSSQELKCAACNKVFDKTNFNKAQLQKGTGKQRCKNCVEAAEKAAASAIAEKKETAIEEAREALQAAELGGDAIKILKASTALSALEGEKVTGVKPRVLGRSRGRASRGRASRGPSRV